MIRRPPRSTLDRSSAASDVYKRQRQERLTAEAEATLATEREALAAHFAENEAEFDAVLSLIHISEPTRPY